MVQRPAIHELLKGLRLTFLSLPMIAFCLICVVPAQKSAHSHSTSVHHALSPAQQLVGSWAYDVATMKLEVNAKGQKTLDDPIHGSDARRFVANMQRKLAAALKTMTITFKADRSVVIKGGNPPAEGTGGWIVTGRKVKVVMTDTKQKTPQMELATDGARIHTVYSDPNFGVSKVDLVKLH